MIDNAKKVLAGLAALAALALGGSAIAGATESGSSSGSQSATEQVAEQESEGRESENDAAAQAAACEAAGVDPQAENVEYDDETGACTLDSGGSDEGEAGEERAENVSGEDENEVREDDGPGGHADSGPDAEHEFEGKE